jgi:hypothetical protein
MSVIEETIASMDERARTLLLERDRHWNEPVRWPGRSPDLPPGEIWASGEKREGDE